MWLHIYSCLTFSCLFTVVHKKSNFAAPKTVTVTSISSTSIKVDVVAPDDATNIDQFNITLKDTHSTRFCGIEAGEYPLECTISGLLEETNYTVEACSWMRSGQICSDFVEATGCTKPKGKLCQCNPPCNE
uniref:Fibronectin type-III domain-containing protein n=1 Tax=Mesocestoides corti TaxID=53468 RepID=A0A5K3FIG3_MESCO